MGGSAGLAALRISPPLRETGALTFYRNTATSWSGRKYRSILKNWPPSPGRASRNNNPDENGADLTLAYAASHRPPRKAAGGIQYERRDPPYMGN